MRVIGYMCPIQTGQSDLWIWNRNGTFLSPSRAAAWLRAALFSAWLCLESGGRTLPVKFLRLDVRPAGAERGTERGSWQQQQRGGGCPWRWWWCGERGGDWRLALFHYRALSNRTLKATLWNFSLCAWNTVVELHLLNIWFNVELRISSCFVNNDQASLFTGPCYVKTKVSSDGTVWE